MSTDHSLSSPRAVLFAVAIAVALLGVGFGTLSFGGSDQQPGVAPPNETATPGSQPETSGGGAGPQQLTQPTPTVTATPIPEKPTEPTEPDPETDAGTESSDSPVSNSDNGGPSGSTSDSDVTETDGDPTAGVEGSTNASVE
jgi:hypothetical protein